MTTLAPRSAHPKPQFMRQPWINLNGAWTYKTENRPTFHLGSDAHREESKAIGFDKSIIVPFAPESPLSGIGDREFITAMWYHRSIEIPGDWAGSSILLHFGAVFYNAVIYLDGEYVGRHVGGSVSFSVDVTPFMQPGRSHNLVVQVTSDLWSGNQPSGKQSAKYDHYGCFYTRTTGIWQTVWLESVNPNGLADVQILPDADSGRFVFIPRFRAIATGQTWTVAVSLDGSACGTETGVSTDGVPLTVSVANPQLWEPGSPMLYDVKFQVIDSDGNEIDEVSSYAGLRKVHIEDNRF